VSKTLCRANRARRLTTTVASALVVGTGLSIFGHSLALAAEPPPPEAVDLDEDPAAEAPPAESEDAGFEVKLADDGTAEASASTPGANDEARPSPLDITPGLRIYSRAFRYTGTLEQVEPGGFAPLVDYNLDAAPMPFINLHWYPLAHMMGGFPAHIGITGGFETGIATKVSYAGVNAAGEAEERTLNQSHTLWYGGLRGRIPVSVLTFGVGANYGNHSFNLKDSSDARPIFPNVSYSFVELGGDVEAQFGSMLVGAQASYLYLMSAGDLVSDDWFATAKGKGVHFSAHVGWAASRAIHLLAGIDARAYGFDFNPVPLDVPADRVAGGATDRYLSFWLGLRFRIPEKGGAAQASSGGSEEKSSGGSDDFDSFD
jgi:hypothetical protein